MSNLIQMFGGQDRFYSKFNRSMFRDPESKDICAVDAGMRAYDETGRTHIACRKLKRLASGRVASTFDTASFPYDFFKDMSVFATPELGYRTNAAGKMLAYISRNPRTYHRGTAVSTLIVEPSELSHWMASEGLVNLSAEQSDSKLMEMVMNPEYLTMTEGLAKIKAGTLASFAVNANVAVTPAEDEAQDIWYKGRRVGTISPEGIVQCSLKYINLISQETHNG